MRAETRPKISSWGSGRLPGTGRWWSSRRTRARSPTVALIPLSSISFQNVTGLSRTMIGCSCDVGSVTGRPASRSHDATATSFAASARIAGPRPIRTTTCSSARRKMAFSPNRRRSAPWLCNPAAQHASSRLAEASAAVNGGLGRDMVTCTLP